MPERHDGSAMVKKHEFDAKVAELESKIINLELRLNELLRK